MELGGTPAQKISKGSFWMFFVTQKVQSSGLNDQAPQRPQALQALEARMGRFRGFFWGYDGHWIYHDISIMHM